MSKQVKKKIQTLPAFADAPLHQSNQHFILVAFVCLTNTPFFLIFFFLFNKYLALFSIILQPFISSGPETQQVLSIVDIIYFEQGLAQVCLGERFLLTSFPIRKSKRCQCFYIIP